MTRYLRSKALWLGVLATLSGVTAFAVLPHSARSAQLLGVSATLVFSSLVGPVTRWASSGWNVRQPLADPPATDASGHRVRVQLLSDDATPGPFVIGVIEVLIFYTAIAMRQPEIIVGWLVFKTAAKWAVWQHIMLMPKTVEGVSEVDFIRYRHAFSSKLATSFIVGTGANILAALGGASIAFLAMTQWASPS